MAKAMVEAWPWAAAIAEKTDRILGRNLSGLCFDGPENRLKETINTQPALFFTSALATEAIRREKMTFSAVAGHSLGEYSALYAAEAASYEDLLTLVDLRARAMQSICSIAQGTMAAVMMLDLESTEAICREASDLGPCVVANINCPGQIVISGSIPAVEKASRLAEARGARRVIPLEVSGAFHSPLMDPVRSELAKAIEQVSFSDTRVAVYTNVDAQPTTKGNDFKVKLLEQINSCVKWEESLRNMWNNGLRHFVELGPGKVLSGLIRKTIPEAVTHQIQDPQTLTSSGLSPK